MGFPINGDLVPAFSGFSNLGVDVSSNATNAFDINSLSPFGHIHLNSGVFHHAVSTGWESGVIRFNAATPAFQISTDGGITFADLTAGAGVDSVGVLGDTNLTGAVDFATPASGFIVIEDSSDASPLLWSVDQLGLSGLWDFPSQGFNGSVVNSLSDFNGTTSQGAISVVGASGIIVDIVGQTMTIASNTDISNVARCYSETFSAATSWVVTHSLGTTNVVVNVYNDASPPRAILPDRIVLTDSNNVTVAFNASQAGHVVILGCT